MLIQWKALPKSPTFSFHLWNGTNMNLKINRDPISEFSNQNKITIKLFTALFGLAASHVLFQNFWVRTFPTAYH